MHGIRRWAWDYSGGVGYNVACAMEIALINLNIVNWDSQWDVNDTALYGIRYTPKNDYMEVVNGFRPRTGSGRLDFGS